MKTPKLIVVDGMDCSGKSTVALPYVEQWFKDRNIPVKRVADLDYTPFGKEIREIFLSPNHARTADITSLVMLSCSARRELIQDVIRPALANGEYVICDRFTSTTFAYADKAENLRTLLLLSEDGTQPDHTVFMSLDYDSYVKRMHNKGGSDDQFECNSREKFEHRLSRYHEYFLSRKQGAVSYVDASKPVEFVQRELDQLLKHIV